MSGGACEMCKGSGMNDNFFFADASLYFNSKDNNLSVKSLPYFIFVLLYIKGHRVFNPLEGGITYIFK